VAAAAANHNALLLRTCPTTSHDTCVLVVPTTQPLPRVLFRVNTAFGSTTL